MMVLRLVKSVLWVCIALATLPFVLHAFDRVLGTWTGDPEAMGYLYRTDDIWGSFAIFAHMATGAVLTFATPLQVIPALRRQAPKVHRISGYALTATALLTACAGLVYIAINGTVGGAWMSFWFAVYGVFMLGTAVMVVRRAAARRFAEHRRWALRLTVLALGSYMYRVHYGLWFAATGGLGVERDFSGLFDQIQVWAFFIPYLALLELWFFIERKRAATTSLATV